MKIDQKDFVQYLTIKKKLSSNSIRAYANRLKIISIWLDKNSTQLAKKSVEDFLFELKEKNRSNAAINTYINTLNHLEGYCKDRNLPIGFMEGIESLPKTQSEIVILSIEEIDRLLNTHLEYKNRNGVSCDNLDDKYLTLTKFLAITGCRFEEAASLKIKRLDIENGRATLVDTKNKQNRFVFFDGPIKNDLKKLIHDRKPDDLVFTNSKGKNIYPGDYNDNLKLRAKKAGINKKVHAHLLRHSFATHLLESGVDVTMVASILGHKDIQTTYDTYVHLADKTLQKAAFKHPLIRQHVNPQEIIKSIKENIEDFHLGNDSRFSYSIKENDNGITFHLKLK